jgi:hypothetical protein
LQRHDFEDRQQSSCDGDVDDALGELGNVFVADYGDGGDAAGTAIGWLI